MNYGIIYGMEEKRKIPYGVMNWANVETVEQALAYREVLARRPDWNHPVSVAVVEVCGNAGYNWFDIAG